MAITKMSLAVEEGRDYQAAIHLQNLLEKSVGWQKVEIERTYTGDTVTELAAVFDLDSIPAEQVQASYRAAVNLWGREGSGFTGPPSFDSNYDPGLEQNQYST